MVQVLVIIKIGGILHVTLISEMYQVYQRSRCKMDDVCHSTLGI